MAGVTPENPRFQKELGYSVTNESIEAVLAGFGVRLDNHPRKILAVGGSGDIPFALLPFVDQIDVVDINPAQIDFIKQRVEQLRAGNTESFFYPGEVGMNDSYGTSTYELKLRKREQYFRQDKRLQQVIESLDKMTLREPRSIFSILITDGVQYPGMYLSNVMSVPMNILNFRDQIQLVQKRLEVNGLAYVADGDRIDSLVRMFVGSKLGIDEPLSLAARGFGFSAPGLPSVYRKFIDRSNGVHPAELEILASK